MPLPEENISFIDEGKHIDNISSAEGDRFRRPMTSVRGSEY